MVLARMVRTWREASSLSSRRPSFEGRVSSSRCSPKHKSKAHSRKTRHSLQTIALIKKWQQTTDSGREGIRGDLLKLDIRRSQTDHPKGYAGGSRHFEPVGRPGKRSYAIMLQRCRGRGPAIRLQVTALFLRPLFAFFDTLVAIAEDDSYAGGANPYRSLSRTAGARSTSVWRKATLCDSRE